MSAQTNCPNCGTALRLDERHRGQVRCPRCQHVFVSALGGEADLPQVEPVGGAPELRQTPPSRPARRLPPPTPPPRSRARDRREPVPRRRAAPLIPRSVLAAIAIPAGLVVLFLGGLVLVLWLGGREADPSPMAMNQPINQRPAGVPNANPDERPWQPPVQPPPVQPLPKRRPVDRPFLPPVEPEIGNRLTRVELAPEQLPELQLPTSTSPKGSLQLGQRQVGKVATTAIDLPAEKLVGDLIWSARGDVFFALTNEGTLSRVALKGLVEEKRLTIDRRCCWLALSAEGLLAALTDLQEVWVIDATTLAIRRRIAAPNVARVLASPTGQIALAAGNNRVTVLDLVRGQALHQFSVPTKHARITPDGKYYFAQGREQLCGYPIKGTDLQKGQTTERIAQNGQSICVSPDSKYVCLPSGGGNYGARPYSTFVYAVENLKKPALTLTSGHYPHVVGFDPAGKAIYAQNYDVALLVYSETAIEKGRHALGQQGDRIRQFVAHPAGGKLLVLLPKELLFVER